jgi:hypothetical protein
VSGRPLHRPRKEDIVFTTRSAVACILACGLLAIAASTATAAPSPEEAYLKSYGSPPAVDVSAAAAEAQERYYTSYGPPAPQDGPSRGTPWLPIVLASLAVVVAAGALGAARHRRRRPHVVRSVPA